MKFPCALLRFLSLSSFGMNTFAAEPAWASAIIIPKVALHEALLEDAVELLRKKCRDLGPEHSGINIVLVPSERFKQTKVDLDLADVPLDRAIRHLALMANLEVTEDGSAFILAEKNRVAPGSLPPTGATKAAQIVLPKLELREAAIDEAVAFPVKKGREFDPRKSGVNIVIVPWDKMRETKITLSLADVSVADAVKYVALVGGLELAVDGDDFLLKAGN